MHSSPVYTGMNLVCKGCEKRIIGSAPYIWGRVRCTVIAKNMLQFWINIDQKVLSAKIHLKEIIHTELVVKIQGHRNRQCVNRGDFLEEFSICPVYTGMNPIITSWTTKKKKFAPCVRGCPHRNTRKTVYNCLFHIYGESIITKERKKSCRNNFVWRQNRGSK